MTADKPDLMRATPRPWRLLADDTGGLFTGWPYIAAAPERDQAVIHRAGFKQEYWESCGQHEALANAALIVTAVNAYDRHLALIATLTKTLEDAPNPAKYVWNHGHSAQFFADYDAWRSRKIAALKLAKESGRA